jgi:hypothetical protein
VNFPVEELLNAVGEGDVDGGERFIELIKTSLL